jgi:hypothetical protein
VGKLPTFSILVILASGVGRIDGRSGTKNIASGKRKCHEMQKKYEWELIEVNFDRKDPILPVECIFQGEATFPKHWEEDDNE